MSALIKYYTSEIGHNLELHSSAVNHILYGDLTDRVHRKDGSTTLEKIIQGGLHTYEGWEKFSSLHPDLVHILYFNSKYHSSWYYARELQNGVITLRIPRHLYSNKAAKITKYPDNYYKSGHLWKTIFPKSFGVDEIVNAIGEALNNIDKETTSEGEIVGYANLYNPLKTMRIVIMYRDNKINSVFPSWTQPNTGNNGKAFSHFENIGHVINAATVFFEDGAAYENAHKSLIDRKHIIQSLISNTPEIFLQRVKPTTNTRKWMQKRERFLKKVSTTTSESIILSIYQYVTDFEICKNHDFICKHGYNEDLHRIEKSIKVFNAFQIHQNIIDSLTILHSYDVCHNKSYFQSSIIFLLKNMVTFVGIDSWVKRKIYHKIVTLLPSYHNIEATKDFIQCFSESPTRREFFVEFSFDTQKRKDLKGPLDVIPEELEIIQNPSLSIKVEYRHYLEYIKENLGETYLLHFEDTQRNSFANQLINSGGYNYKNLISDVIRYTEVSDFYSFSESFAILVRYIISNNATDEIEDAIHLIMRDYCRIQFAQRLRANMLYKDYLNTAYEIEFPLTNDFIQQTILKHERILISTRIDHFLDSIEALVPLYSDSNLGEEIKEYRAKAKKEVPPFPEPLPSYIMQRTSNFE